MDSPNRATHHFGVRKCFELPGVTLAIVQIENSGNSIGWHYHENPHLTFVLRGAVTEGTRKKVYECSPGELLFHSSFEPHYNAKPQGHVTCLHVDFAETFLDDFGTQKRRLQGIFSITDPGLKFSCYRLFREALIGDEFSEVSIHTVTLDIIGRLLPAEDGQKTSRPSWVQRLEDILRSDYAEKLSLAFLSRELSIHPVHLSRSFSRYFHCTLGEYVRNVRLERSLALMSGCDQSLTDIASTCGFSDQSHFTRSFKEIMGVTPSAYRKLLSPPR
jgi:AraC family transcriptional regulator